MRNTETKNGHNSLLSDSCLIIAYAYHELIYSSQYYVMMSVIIRNVGVDIDVDVDVDVEVGVDAVLW